MGACDAYVHDDDCDHEWACANGLHAPHGPPELVPAPEPVLRPESAKNVCAAGVAVYAAVKCWVAAPAWPL